jgi:hypothetical protein
MTPQQLNKKEAALHVKLMLPLNWREGLSAQETEALKAELKTILAKM